MAWWAVVRPAHRAGGRSAGAAPCSYTPGRGEFWRCLGFVWEGGLCVGAAETRQQKRAGSGSGSGGELLLLLLMRRPGEGASRFDGRAGALGCARPYGTERGARCEPSSGRLCRRRCVLRAGYFRGCSVFGNAFSWARPLWLAPRGGPLEWVWRRRAARRCVRTPRRQSEGSADTGCIVHTPTPRVLLPVGRASTPAERPAVQAFFLFPAAAAARGRAGRAQRDDGAACC